jgi:hypothetical protein
VLRWEKNIYSKQQMLKFGITEHIHFLQLRHKFFKTNTEENHRLLYIGGPYKLMV